MRKGDRVVAKEEISIGWLSSVKAGTTGVVVKDPGIMSGPTVAFEGHSGTHVVSEGKLQRN